MINAGRSEQQFFILTALVDQPRHGYGILQEVVLLSEGRVQLKVASLYGLLDRLTTEGLIEADRDEAHNGRLRRYHRLTDTGAGVLAEETARLEANARVATARLRAHRPATGARPTAAGGPA